MKTYKLELDPSNARKPRPRNALGTIAPTTRHQGVLRAAASRVVGGATLAICWAALAAGPAPRLNDFVASGDSFTAGFVRPDGAVEPPPFNGRNGNILLDLPGYVRQRLWFARGVIPTAAEGGPRFTTCTLPELGINVSQFEHIQDIQPIGDWSKGAAYFMVSHSQRNFGHLFVLKTTQVAGAPNEHELFGFHGNQGAPPDGVGVWHRQLNFAAEEQWYNHPGDMAAVGDIVVVVGENWGGAQSCILDRVNDPATGRPPEDAILFYDVANPEDPKYLGKIPLSSFELPFPFELTTVPSLGALRIGDVFLLQMGPFWFESDAMVPEPARWRLTQRAILGTPPGFGTSVRVQSPDTGLAETWLLRMDPDGYQARPMVMTETHLLFPPLALSYSLDEGIVSEIVVFGQRTLQAHHGVHVSRRGRMSYVSCASGFGVRKVIQGGVVPVIGSVGQDVLEMDIHSIHHWDDVTWPSGFEILPTLEALSDQAGWGEQRFYSTIRTGDVDGDGRAEVLARSAGGLVVWSLREAGWQQLPGSIPLADPAWAVDSYNSTIQVADLNGDGRVEVLARSALGLHAWSYDGSNWNELPGLLPFSDATGWANPQYYRTIQTADIDGDGRAEVLARSALGMHAWKHTGTGWQQLDGLIPFTDALSWNQPRYYLTIQTADVTGDGRAEVLARSRDGMTGFRFTGTAWEALPGLIPFTDAMAWDQPAHYLTIQAGDIDGDGRAEVLGRGAMGMAVWHHTGSGWEFKTPNFLPFADSAGWDLPRHFLTIQTADLNGDGQAEILARSAHGLGMFRYVDGEWNLLPSRLAYADSLNWDDPKYFTTIQTADVDGDGRAEILARSAFGLEVRKLRGARHHTPNPNRQPLRIEAYPGQPGARLVWDDFADGMRLEQTERLQASPWIRSPETGTREGSRRVLPLTLEGWQRYYRLWFP